jgi:hypothetical protein
MITVQSDSDQQENARAAIPQDIHEEISRTGICRASAK